MYKTILKAGPSIDISYRNFTFQYAINGEAPNPLEAMYASIAGCAGVYAKKSCKSLGISDEGISISVKPVAAPSHPLLPVKIVTTLDFPSHFTAEQRVEVLASISQCAVKELIAQGASIEFVQEEVR
jgi:uncharacterized OsmC-like protein